ncbi:MAG: adenosylmethionine decarboxylase [Betaproteobacteria bacterium]|nr:adenosylmethionine decarboxylase [Betaproteobacteria bacterium]
MNAPRPPRPAVLGRHLLLDLQGVSPTLLGDAALIERTLFAAARAAGATPVEARFQHFGPGLGVTGVLLLRESHISIHTWPEYEFAAVDIFMCGMACPEAAAQYICDAFAPSATKLRDEARGATENLSL